MQTARATLPLLVLCLSSAAVVAQPRAAIARFERAPTMDGTLTDAVWRRATVFSDFKTAHPRSGLEPAERTEVYVAYDRANIYVGVRALDRSADSIRARAKDLSGAFDDDWVAFAVDSRDQGLDAFFFLVTAGGVRLSGTLDGTGSPTPGHDSAWTSIVKRSPAGYTAEMRIPLAPLAYARGDRVPMAFKVMRFVSRRREEDHSPALAPDRPAVAQFRRIALSGIVPSLRSADLPLFDVRAALEEKRRLIATIGDSTLAQRILSHGDASVLDHLLLPGRALHASGSPYRFARPIAGSEFGSDKGVAALLASVDYLPGRPIGGDLARVLSGTQTTSFIVIRNDTVLYEKYFNGWARDSIFASFSMAKTFGAMLVGIAIEKGQIHGVGDSVTAYLPELARRDARFNRITIRDLLRMSSGLRYVENAAPYDDRRTYMDPDLRRAGLEGTTIVEEPGKHWLYNNYNPMLIGMVLERVSGHSVTELLQSGIWEPLGMEFGGSWSLDSRASGFEKMECCINARSIDFAKFGGMLLHHGAWNGRRVVPAQWIAEASQPWPSVAGYFGDEGYMGRGGHYYGYFTWGDNREGGESDFHAVGNKGQYIYVSPQKHVVIVRTGIQYGIPSAQWVRVLRELVDRL